MNEVEFRIDHSKKPEEVKPTESEPVENGSVTSGPAMQVGFSSVSAEAMKFLQPDEEKEPQPEQMERPKRKFILSRKTLAKQAVKFGPANEIEKKKAEQRRIIIVSGAAVAALMVILIIVAIVVNWPKPSTIIDGIDYGGDTKPQNGLYSGIVTVVVNGQGVKYEAEKIVNGVEVTVGAETFELNDEKTGFLVVNGGKLTFDGTMINKTSAGDAVVVVGEGSAVTMNGATIETTGDRSSAVNVTNGGQVKMSKTAINTSGDLANLIQVGDKGKAELSAVLGNAAMGRIAVINGAGTIMMNGCDFSAMGKGEYGVEDAAAILMYQSGYRVDDADTGILKIATSDFEVTQSDLYTETAFLLVTNTVAEVTLKSVNASFYDGQKLIKAAATMWGTDGLNGANVRLSMSRVNASNMSTSTDSLSTLVHESN